MPTIAKVGIGCGIFAIIGVVVTVMLVGWCTKKVGDFAREFSENPERTAAEMIVRANKDLDLVKTDDAAGTITFRDKSGKETTMNWSDLAEGRFTITDSDGSELTFGGDMSSVPAWVPRLPRAASEVSSHRMVEGGKTTGSYMVTTPMVVSEIEEFIAAQAAALEMEAGAEMRKTSDGHEMRILGFQGGGRSLNVTIIHDPAGDTTVQFIYDEETEP